MEVTEGVLVDSFTHKRHNTIYFLTHWHADHYAGINHKWPYGPIYCSHITRRLLLIKYPKLSEIAIGLPFNQFISIKHQGLRKGLRVQLFNSNHMAGSAMILFEVSTEQQEERGSQVEYTLHTGDMRFNARVLKQETGLFVDKKDKMGEFECKYPISRLYLDNTYCDPIFQFPNRSDALGLIKLIIDQELKNLQASSHSRLKVLLVTDSVGKEEAFIAVAKHYQTPIMLSEERFRYCEAMFQEQQREQLMKKIFIKEGDSPQPSRLLIEVIKRSQKEGKMNMFEGKDGDRKVFISLTGWANLLDFHRLSDNEYIVPYSLHSNYLELELFMSVVRPKELLPIVYYNPNRQSQNFRHVVHSFGAYMGSLMYMKQRGIPFFREQYTLNQTHQNCRQEKPDARSTERKEGEPQMKGINDNWIQIQLDSK